MMHDTHLQENELWNYLIYFDKFERFRKENKSEVPAADSRDKMTELHLLTCPECFTRFKHIRHIYNNPDTAILEAFPILTVIKAKSILEGFRDSGTGQTEYLSALLTKIETEIDNSSWEIFQGIFQSEYTFHGPRKKKNVEIISNYDLKNKVVEFKNGKLILKFTSVIKFDQALLIAKNDFFPGKTDRNKKQPNEMEVTFQIYKKEDGEDQGKKKKPKKRPPEESYIAYFYKEPDETFT
jgi:hypothetical protein